MSKKKRGEEYMKEEDNILKKVASGDSFKVPEGYFEGLTSEVMNKLPEKEKIEDRVETPTLWVRMKPMFYMAALFIGAALIIRVASSSLKPSSDEITVTAADTEVVSDQYIDAMVDQSMMDDYSLYVYLNDASAE